MPILLAVLATTVRANTYTYEFTQKVFSKNGTQSLGGVDWTLQTDGRYIDYDKRYNRGQQIGKKKAPAKSLSLSTSGFKGTINAVKVETSGASGTNATLKVTVGGAQIGQAYTLTSTSTEIEFKGSGTGEVVLSYGQTSSTAIYIKKIIVDYEESGEPPVVPKPTQTVNGLSALKSITDGTPVRLYIGKDDDARVLFAGNDDAFIRDKDCTVCFSGVKAKPAMAYNQHIAGYIVGKKMTQNGMTTLQAVADTHTAFLVMAAPVQESDVEPAVMKAGEHATHLGDWVTMKDLTMKNGKLEANGQTYMLNNAYGLDGNSFYQQPYEGAIVDLSAIVYPTATGIELRPIYNKVEKTEAHNVEARDFRPLIYVIDEARNFTSPTADIPHATVRLHRTFSPDKWNTLALPFAVTFEGGKLRKYDNVDGQTMKFVEAASVEPGVPYLFKPATVIENPTYTDVTLSKTEARKVMHGSCGFAGTYSPYTMKTDKTERFLGEGNKLYWPDTTTSPDANKMKGLRAYFMVPETMTEAKVSIVGETTAIDNVATDHPAATANARVYNLNGQFVGIGTAGLPKGIYIVNGKKMVIN